MSSNFDASLDEWVLILMYSPPKQGFHSRLHLQKAFFILSKSIEGIKEAAEFIAYKKGPYSENLEDRLRDLEDYGYISTQNNKLILKEAGKRYAHDLWNKVPEEIKKRVTSVKDFIESLDEDELLLYIYAVHGSAEKSDLYDRIMKQKIQIALRMLSKGVISSGLAAKLAGLSLEDFIKEARLRGIKPYSASLKDLEIADS